MSKFPQKNFNMGETHENPWKNKDWLSIFGTGINIVQGNLLYQLLLAVRFFEFLKKSPYKLWELLEARKLVNQKKNSRTRFFYGILMTILTYGQKFRKLLILFIFKSSLSIHQVFEYTKIFYIQNEDKMYLYTGCFSLMYIKFRLLLDSKKIWKKMLTTI